MLIPPLLLQAIADGHSLAQAIPTPTQALPAHTTGPDTTTAPPDAPAALPTATPHNTMVTTTHPHGHLGNTNPGTPPSSLSEPPLGNAEVNEVNVRETPKNPKIAGGCPEILRTSSKEVVVPAGPPSGPTTLFNHFGGVNTFLSETTFKNQSGIVLGGPLTILTPPAHPTAHSTAHSTAHPPRKKRVLSEETKAKMSRAKLGKGRSDETKEKIRLALKGRGKTPAHREASSLGHKRRFDGCPEGFEWLRLPKNVREAPDREGQPSRANRRNYWVPAVVPYFFEWANEFEGDPPHLVAKLDKDQYNSMRDLHECASASPPTDYNGAAERITIGFRRFPNPLPHKYSSPSPGDTAPRGSLTINGYFRLPEESLTSFNQWHPLRVGDTVRRVACAEVTFVSPLFGRCGPEASFTADVYLYEE